MIGILLAVLRVNEVYWKVTSSLSQSEAVKLNCCIKIVVAKFPRFQYGGS